MRYADGPFLLTSSVPPARVGEQLLAARTRAGLSRTEAARRMGVPRRWLARWERGSRWVPDAVLHRAAEALTASLEELVPQRVPLRLDPDAGALVLGAHRVPVDVARAGNEGVLRAYLELVSAARERPAVAVSQLRSDDLAVLAELLDLDDDELEPLLVRVLGVPATSASAVRSRLRRQRLTAAAVGATVLAMAPAASAASPAPAPAPQRVWRSLALVDDVAPVATPTATHPSNPVVGGRLVALPDAAPSPDGSAS